MHLNSLTPSPGSHPGKKRLGRGIGSGKGKTAGRGHKGQKARAGKKLRPGFEGGQMALQRRLPKFGFTSGMARITGEVRLSELERLEQDVIDIEVLQAANILQKGMTRAKVIATGEIKRAVTLKGLRATAGAREAIEKAGGKIEE